MGKLKGTKTETNILTAFAGESQARNRYTYFAAKAKKEGYEQIAAVFAETADQEKEHAKRLFKLLEGGEASVTASFPAGTIGSTFENLTGSAGGEHHECASMYPDFAAVAKQEGFGEIAAIFSSIAVAERFHEERFRALAANIEKGRVFHKSEPVSWRCRNCGFVHDGTDAPANCPACAHPQAHFEVRAENW
ncbi:MAG: rubrerythrin family protein [Desulfovibrionaceae bacterium]|nr:rubrerythrin family protein [Desulfovibrionaceae bacterium]MBF0514771.1 rubrerythrin family protein [Desulfovibrionaceae bacterium]